MKSDNLVCLDGCSTDLKTYTDETNTNNFKCTLCTSAISDCDTCSSFSVCTICD